MAIQAIGGGVGLDLTSMTQAVMKKLDTNHDGSVIQSEFSASLKNASGTSEQDSVELFSAFDLNSNGSITQSELGTVLKQLSTSNSSSSSSSTSANGGMMSMGGAGGAGGAGGVTSSGSSGSATIYDVRDTNKDGSVSYEEALAYKLANPTEETSSTETTLNNFMKQFNMYYQQNTSNTTSSSVQSVVNTAV
jgi:Ca2+-binding EF-hand superfamily protein